MQKDQNELEIGDLVVYPGSKVNVKWRGVWFEGTVIKIGPQRRLCRVCDLSSNQMILADPQTLKPRESRVLDKRLLPGTHVMYNDGQSWREGRIESNTAVGAALVRWKQNVLGEETDTWFEVKHIAPVIQNEAYIAYNQNPLEIGKTHLFPNDVIEPRPRTVRNPLHQQEQAPSRAQQMMHTSPTYESIASEDFLGEFPHDHVPPPPPRPPAFPHMPPMMYPAFGRMRHASSFGSSHDHKKPQAGGFRKSLEQSSLPCTRSYTSQMGGIPPHHTSKFFKHFQKQKYMQHLSALNHFRYASLPQTRSASTKNPSSPIASEPHSEPYAAKFFYPTHLTRQSRREKLRGKATREPSFLDKKSSRHQSPIHQSPRQQQSPKHHSPHHKGIPPQPYEIPVRSAVLTKQKSHATQPPVKQNKNETDVVAYAEVRFPKEKGPPVIASASPPVVSVHSGGSLLLTCVASSTIPVVYKWLKEGKTIPDDNHRITRPAPGMLHIHHASLEKDGGEYSCVVSNKCGTVSRTFQLKVIPVPYLKSRNTKSSTSTGADAQLLTTFANKVTYEELNMEPPEEHRDSEPATSHPPPAQAPPTTETLKEAKVENRPEKPPATTNQPKEAEKGNAAPAIPKIIVTEDRKTLKHNRTRVSSVLENTMDQYLEGYGDDYGALSSDVNLEQEGLTSFQPIEIARSLDRLNEERRSKDKKKEKDGDSESKETGKGTSKQTSTQSKGKSGMQPKASPPKISKKPFSFPKLPKTPRFTKKNKKGFGASDKWDETVQMTAHIKELPEPGHFKLKTIPSNTPGITDRAELSPRDDKGRNGNETKYTDSVAERTPLAEDVEEVNSITVNTSVGSSDSELSLADGESGGDASLPMEMESVIDQVRRLQLSLEEYGQNFEEEGKAKKKGFIPSLFKSKTTT